MNASPTHLLRAYAAWIGHARKCEECKRVPRATDGCEAGQELWSAYRLANSETPTITGGGV